jgi:hypothetical protein
MRTLINAEGKVSSGVPIDHPSLAGLYGSRAVEPFARRQPVSIIWVLIPQTLPHPGLGDVTVGVARVAQSQPSLPDRVEPKSKLTWSKCGWWGTSVTWVTSSSC